MYLHVLVSIVMGCILLQPRSIENYLQEIGRAGRDSLPSTCQLFLHKEDMIHQHSLAQANRLCRLQLIYLFMVIFKRVDKDDSFFRQNHLPNPQSQKKSFQQTLCISLAGFESATDCPNSVLETLLSILELDPFRLFVLEGVYLDKIVGSFRLPRRSVEEMASRDPLVRALLTHAIAHSRRNESFDSDEDGDEQYSRQLHSEDSIRFECSRLSLAVSSQILVTDLPSRLFRLQQDGVLQYNLSDPAVYLTLPSHGLVGSVVVNVDDDRYYYEWIWQQSIKLFQLLNQIDDLASERIENMWKVGKTLAAFSNPKNRANEEANVQIQRDLQSFIALAMEGNMDHNGLESPNTENTLSLMVKLFHEEECPFETITFDSECVQSTRDSDCVGKASLQVRSIALVLRQDPHLLDTLKLLLNSTRAFLSVCDGISFEGGSSTLHLASDLKDEAIALYIVRVLHGLPTKHLAADTWRNGFFSDCWGKFKDFKFGDLILFVKSLMCAH